MRLVVQATTDDVLRHYRNSLPLKDSLDKYEQQMLKDYTASLKTFIAERRKMINHLNTFTVHANRNVQVKSAEVNTYRAVADFLSRMEQDIDLNNLELEPNHLEYVKTELIFDNKGMNLQERIEKMAEEQNNSFEHIRNWVKAEYLML